MAEQDSNWGEQERTTFGQLQMRRLNKLAASRKVATDSPLPLTFVRLWFGLCLGFGLWLAIGSRGFRRLFDLHFRLELWLGLGLGLRLGLGLGHDAANGVHGDSSVPRLEICSRLAIDDILALPLCIL